MKLYKISLAVVYLLQACTSGGARNEEPVTPPERSIPAAILGEAGPPSGANVQYFAGDSLAVGYLAVPEGEGPFPALILIHEWNGLVDRVR